jgi:hypothetical protein
MKNDTLNFTLRYRFAAVLVASWLALVVLGFWWFSARFISPFGEVLVSFDGHNLASQAPILSKVTVVGLIDTNCPCSSLAQNHWVELQRDNPNTVFELATMSNRWSFLLASVDVSPAVAVWSADGHLRYLGPFSGGAMCGSGDDFVAMALGSIAAGEPLQWINQDAVGCFCRRKRITEET